MKIWINRAGQNLGTFTLEEVQRGLDQGQFVPADLGWQEGMETWKPLSELPGLRMPPPELPPPPPSLVTDPAATQPPALIGSEPKPAWERRRDVGAIRAYFLTIREVLFESGPTFAQFNPNGNLLEPTWFFLITIAIQAVFAFGFELLTLPHNRAALDVQRQLNLSLLGFLLVLPLLLVLGVVITLVANFILVGLYHGMLKLLGGTSLPYRATYRVVTYSHAAQIFGVVPCLGPIVAIIMFLVAASTGLQRVHQTQYWKAMVALIVPYILCFGMLLLIFSSVLSVLVNASHQPNP
jgi:hypothetical protein